MPNRFSIFYVEHRDEQGLLVREFGVRYDSQALPAGAIVVGFCRATAAGFEEVLDPGYMVGVEESNYLSVLAEARREVGAPAD